MYIHFRSQIKIWEVTAFYSLIKAYNVCLWELFYRFISSQSFILAEHPLGLHPFSFLQCFHTSLLLSAAFLPLQNANCLTVNCKLERMAQGSLARCLIDCPSLLKTADIGRNKLLEQQKWDAALVLIKVRAGLLCAGMELQTTLCQEDETCYSKRKGLMHTHTHTHTLLLHFQA